MKSNSIKVLKFGGSSVKNVARIQHVAALVASACAHSQCIVVVSAMGDTTDYLLSLAGQCAAQPDKRELDQLLSTGEQAAVALLGITLCAMGKKARSYTGQQIGMITDAAHTRARILDIDALTWQQGLEQNDVLVVAGFQGSTQEGETTTLGRGGSDTSAVALAAACGVSEVDIYTDVDGICTADPNLVKGAALLKEISYEQALLLASQGAQVIHPRAVCLARDYGITIRVRNTFKPWHSGTEIKGAELMEKRESITGVALDKRQKLVRLHGIASGAPAWAVLADLLEEHAIGAGAIAQTVGENGLKSISLVLQPSQADSWKQVLSKLKEQLGDINGNYTDIDAAKLSIVGQGLSAFPSYAAKLLCLLQEARIDALQITCSDELITCLVPSEEGERACALIHSVFGLEEPGKKTAEPDSSIPLSFRHRRLAIPAIWRDTTGKAFA